MIRRAVLTASLTLVGAAVAVADLAEITKRGTLKVIAVREEAPEMVSFAASGEPGFEREMVEAFGRLHNLKVALVPVDTSEERIKALQRGDGDLILGIVATEPRRKLIDFTVEVLPARHVVISYKPNPVIRTVEEFRAAKVGVVRGTSWAQAAIEAGVPADKLENFAQRYDALDALRDGRIAATVMTVSDFTLATRKYPGLQPGVYVGPASSAGWGLRKTDTDLRAALDEYLDNFRKGPGWNRLVVKYFGEQALAVLGRGKQ